MSSADERIINRLQRIYEAQGAGGTAFEELTGEPTDNAALGTALNGKVPSTRTVAGKALSSDVTLVKADVGLGNVDNTADTAKPVSTAQQTALNLKAPLASPALTGNPTAPTQSAADNSTKIATTFYADRAGAHSGGVIGTAVITIANDDSVTVDFADGIFTGAINTNFVYDSSPGTLGVAYAGDGGAQNFPSVTWESVASLTASMSAVSAAGFTATFRNSATEASAGTTVDVVRITVHKLSQ